MREADRRKGGPASELRTAAPRGQASGRPLAPIPGAARSAVPSSAASASFKQFRAVATRYDKRDFMYQATVDMYQATVDVASIRIRLRDPVS